MKGLKISSRYVFAFDDNPNHDDDEQLIKLLFQDEP